MKSETQTFCTTGARKSDAYVARTSTGGKLLRAMAREGADGLGVHPYNATISILTQTVSYPGPTMNWRSRQVCGREFHLDGADTSSQSGLAAALDKRAGKTVWARLPIADRDARFSPRPDGAEPRHTRQWALGGSIFWTLHGDHELTETAQGRCVCRVLELAFRSLGATWSSWQLALPLISVGDLCAELTLRCALMTRPPVRAMS